MKRIKTINKLIRNFIYPIVAFISFWIFIEFTNTDEFNKNQILSTIISVISIIIAIIVTYLFSKLFAEKTTRIERKKEIDLLSSKVTSLRKMAFHIRGLHEFWKFNGINVKSIIDHKYKDLSYEEYRGYEVPGHRKFTSEELTKIDKDIYGTNGQAYLALKGLEDGENSYSFFAKFNPKNYSLDDIVRYKEYAGSFWYFLDRSSDEIVNFNGCSRYWLNSIDELYYQITGNQIDQDNYKKSIKDLLSEFDSLIFEKHYYLNSLNSTKLSGFYRKGLLNMMIFLLLLIIAVFIFVLDLRIMTSFLSTIILLSFFIANTLDLIIITVQSIRTELEVNEIYSI
ncbi:hypothetical protein [Sinomicrobium oceani]|uniref:hypothetical protein n=1 Tax=Sinomicrobium oceani TaxID=1150368 RepID=UPI00227C2833|nr:hypothetical protein [Sinomicrobium oceani]